MIVVVDASAVGSFLLPDEQSRFSAFALEVCSNSEVVVPPHWASEVAAILWKAHRRQRIDAAQLADFGRAATSFARTVGVGNQVPIDELTTTAIDCGLTAYDTAYLLLAQARRASLLTADKALAAVASGRGIEVLAP